MSSSDKLPESGMPSTQKALDDSELIFSACYVSTATVPFTEADISKLVQKASLTNAKVGVTGLLCYHHQRFFQYLEGSFEAVTMLLQTIAEDERHDFITTLELPEQSERRFKDWSMMRVNSNSRGLSSLVESMIKLCEDISKSRLDPEGNKQSLLMLVDCVGRAPMKETIEADFAGRKIIVIGASAGGIEPTKYLLSNLPKNIDSSIIVVLHLSPDHDTVLHSILERVTGFNVCIAQEGDLLAPGKVLLIPPGKDLTVQNGAIRLSDQERIYSGNIPCPIDVVLCSLAEQYGRKVIGIILSGSGHDGARGVRVLHEAGGFILAQKPESAEFDSMPISAIESGAVNRVLDIEGIAALIKKIVDSRIFENEPQLSETEKVVVEQILQFVKDNGTDFSHYKRQTIINRLQRRRVLIDVESIEEYYALLLSSDTEKRSLVNDLLICVTDFFRDPAAWSVLRSEIELNVLPNLDEDEVVRVWIAGCATGEEAYSVGIMLSELLEQKNLDNDFKIYATDLSDDGIEKTSDGIYAHSALGNLNEHQIQRFFNKTTRGYEVSSELRKRTIATKHNLVQDAPFTRMHLVCCRNVLIYMDSELQTHVLKLLHFALQAGGVLFMGPSESTGLMSREFNVLSHEWNILSKIREFRIPLHLKDAPTEFKLPMSNSVSTGRTAPAEHKLEEDLYRLSLEVLCNVDRKTAVVLNEKREISLVIADQIGLLQVAMGSPGARLEKLLTKSLVPSVVTHLQQLQKMGKERVAIDALPGLDNQGAEITVDMDVTRLKATDAKEQWLITFKTSKADNLLPSVSALNLDLSSSDENPDVDVNAYNMLLLKHEKVANQLEDTRQVLFDTVQELEVLNDEQEAAREQLTATNEELQSTNEELQSVNEELYTVNFEYQAKIHELSDLTNDLNNLLRSTNLGVVFIDSQLNIRRLTDHALKILGVDNDDIKVPLEVISNRLGFAKLNEIVSRVITLGDTFETDLDYQNCPSRLHVGIYPYRVDSDLAQGVIITLLDLAEIKTFALEQLDATPEAEPV